MTQLVLDEDREPAIIVGADVNMATRTSEYSPDGERFRSYCRFFAEEMLPFIENKYAVRRDKGQRILAGDSLGGTVSLHLALDYRDLFCQVISLSGAFLWKYPGAACTRNRFILAEDVHADRAAGNGGENGEGNARFP